MKLPKLCRKNNAIAVAVPVEQADASQARFEALMSGSFHNGNTHVSQVRDRGRVHIKEGRLWER